MSIAITGIGYSSPEGCGVERFEAELQSGPRPDCKFTDYNVGGRMPKRGLRFSSPATQLFTTTALQAVEDAGLEGLVVDAPTRFGVYHGTEASHLPDSFAFDQQGVRDGPESVSPMQAPNTLANVASGVLAMQLGLKGPNVTVSNGECSGLSALAVAEQHLRTGMVDVAIVGSVEVGSHVRDGMLLAGSGPDAPLPSRELGVCLVLERKQAAEARGAKIVGKIASITPVRRASAQGRRKVVAERTLATAIERAGGAQALLFANSRPSWGLDQIGLGGPDLLSAVKALSAPGDSVYGRTECSAGLLAVLLSLRLLQGGAFGAGLAVSKQARRVGVLCFDDDGSVTAGVVEG